MLVCCAAVEGAVFRDRASFNAASQNLNTIDFNSTPNVPDGLGFLEIDGVFFRNPGASTENRHPKWEQASVRIDLHRIHSFKNFPATRYHRRRL